MRGKILIFLATFVAPWVLDVYYRTLKIQIKNFKVLKDCLDNDGAVIVVFWHEHIMLPVYVLRFSNMYGLVSQHLDGEIITRIIRHFGHGAIRGSSTRGGKQAYRNAKQMLKSQRIILAITPDGPLGPRRKAKLGAVRLASETGIPIVPISVKANRYKRMKSWDRFLLILPFANCEIKFGEPFRVPPNLTVKRLKEYNKHLEQILNHMNAE